MLHGRTPKGYEYVATYDKFLWARECLERERIQTVYIVMYDSCLSGRMKDNRYIKVCGRYVWALASPEKEQYMGDVLEVFVGARTPR